ncbi:hypothetical protein WICMUC_005940 [Wickerhamomyces mucosus]|uniref:Protein URE2 n=1 Tax=Wickerhamomyces mucosus TaxID=1378264 RepID=A0A9P8P1L3_9ASCO|nr:hypothetical protein WICMUC_005940 [Wickerhamomyces mucosus]
MSQRQISNLSSALKSVNINNQNLNTQQQQEYEQHQNLQQIQNNLQNENNNHNNDNNNINRESESRITAFFKNPPLEGYTLFSHRSAPNGFKVAIVLSELNLDYNTIFLDFNRGEQRAPEFVSINPNARVPALIDHNSNHLSLWESGSIILYLVEKYSKEVGYCPIFSNDPNEKSQIISWIFFQTSGHAPMIGQALHFKYFHQQQIPSAINRYIDEVRRVYGVLEMQLAEKREALIMELDVENAAAYSSGTTPLSQSKFFDYPIWLVGEHITIADLSFVPWNNVVDRIGIDIKLEFPECYKWTKNMMRRPNVIKALRGEH